MKKEQELLKQVSDLAIERGKLWSDAKCRSKMIEDQQSEIQALTLALTEERILLTASVKRNNILVGAIARHKKVMFGDTLPPFPDDQDLYKMLGEVEL